MTTPLALPVVNPLSADSVHDLHGAAIIHSYDNSLCVIVCQSFSNPSHPEIQYSEQEKQSDEQ